VAEGTYGVVYRARDTASGGVVALKKVKLAHPGGAHTNTGEVGFPLTALREVTTLLACDHPAIVGVSEVVVGRGGESVYLVMEWADHDLSGLAAAMPRRFSISEVKTLIHQLASGLAYLHARWVLHRDVKPANILYTHRGSLKLADFGLARAYGSPLRPYTRPVVTLYYRAPELLLGSPTYSTPIDAWSLGCVMGELLAGKGKILFEARAGRGGPAAGELAQLAAITKILGPIDEASWPGCSSLPGLQAMQYTTPGSGLRSLFPAPGGGADASTRLSDAGLDLLSGLLHYDPSRRLTAAQVLTHPWFEEFPPPAPPELMPTYPSTQAGRGGK
jgi:cell division cycle 2-like